MDLQMTKDGQIVLFHDYETVRTTGVENKIQELDLNSVKKLNSGYNFEIGSEFPYRQNPIRIPTLEEVCQSFPDAKLLLDIHTEDLSAINKIIEIIERNGMEKQIVVVSHYDEVLSEFKAKRPSWTYGAATKEVKKMVYSSFLFMDSFFPINSDILMLPVKFGNIKLLTKRVVNHIKTRNKRLWLWLSEGKEVITVNTNRELKGLEEIGADGIFTEFPAKLKEEITVANNI